MISAENIIKLVDAGFTAEQIRAMDQPEADPAGKKTSAADAKTQQAGTDQAKQTAGQQAAGQPEDKTKQSAAEKKDTPTGLSAEEFSAVVSAAIESALKSMDESIKEMTAAFKNMPYSPSLQNIKPVGIDDVLAKFFKE